MYLEVYMLFNEVYTNIRGALLTWKFWTLEKCCCLVNNVCSILAHSMKSESYLYQDSKCCSCHLISWVRIVKRLLKIAGCFISTKLRFSLKCISIKIMILCNGKSFRIWDGGDHGKRKVCCLCSWAEGCPGRCDLFFSCLQVNTGRQKVCCYCLCRVITDAVNLLK